MSKVIQISKAGWLKVFSENNEPSYFTNLNQYETIKKGELTIAEAPQTDQPYFIELIKPGHDSGTRITFPTVHDRDEIFRGLAEAL
jgi:hypothetical protein